MLDRATILGLTATIALIAWVMIDGTGLGAKALWHGSAAALVVGGVVFTTLVAFPWGRFSSVGGLVRNTMVVRMLKPEELIATITGLAYVARRDGLLSLEKPVEELNDDFLMRAMRMAVDGADARTIEQICRTELESTDARHASGSSLFETAGKAAPVFGMMGTVIGLIVMLGQLNDPTKIGPGMSVALLATLYGLLVANVFCLPMARKLTHRSSAELLNKTIALTGVLAIQAGDNPRVVEQKLRAYLPASAKVEPVKHPISQVAKLKALADALRKLSSKRSSSTVAPSTPTQSPQSNKLMEAA